MCYEVLLSGTAKETECRNDSACRNRRVGSVRKTHAGRSAAVEFHGIDTAQPFQNRRNLFERRTATGSSVLAVQSAGEEYDPSVSHAAYGTLRTAVIGRCECPVPHLPIRDGVLILVQIGTDH